MMDTYRLIGCPCCGRIIGVLVKPANPKSASQRDRQEDIGEPHFALQASATESIPPAC